MFDESMSEEDDSDKSKENVTNSKSPKVSMILNRHDNLLKYFFNFYFLVYRSPHHYEEKILYT